MRSEIISIESAKKIAKYSKLEEKILTAITENCENCRAKESCYEEECVLYRIEQLISNKNSMNKTVGGNDEAQKSNN